MFCFSSWRRTAKRKLTLAAFCSGLMLLIPGLTRGQSWVWTTETVDTSGTGTSLAVDKDGNVHMAYSGKAGVKYGFRGADQPRWFTMLISEHAANHTSLTIDRQGNPHVCGTSGTRPLRYAHIEKQKWIVEDLGSDSAGIEYTCTVGTGSDGTPHLTWYKLGSSADSYSHTRYAVLKDGAWMSRTLDFDKQTGKWHSMVIDSHGNPYVSYDAYVKGLLKCAHWDGQNWKIKVVDARGLHGSDYSIGMGSSIILDSQENPHISYYTTNELRHAWQQNGIWKVESVDGVAPDHGAQEYRSSLIFDKNGFPHISYENLGVLKHAYWDGKKWRIQVIAPGGPAGYRYSSMAVDSNRNILYIGYRDGADGTLKVAIGRFDQPQTMTQKKDGIK